MKCSYGVKTNVPFDKRRHAAKQMVLMDGEVKCDNIFSPIIEKDQMVEAGTTSCIREHSENPPTIRIIDRSFADLLERVFFIKVMMLSIVGVKSLIIKSAYQALHTNN
jgi:hypothetical protein